MGTTLVISLIPLFLFAIFNYYKGLKSGVVLGMISSLGVAFYLWIYLDYWDYDIFIMILLFVVMGFLSIKKNDELYFKLQPVISGFFSALFLIWYQFMDQPFIVKMLPKIMSSLPADTQIMLQQPEAIAMMSRLTGFGIIWILLHSLVLGWAAVCRSTSLWLFVKAAFIPYFFAASLISEYIFNQMS